ncbi:MAG TPA: diguanylate cyclase [Thermoanaerobaculia bacterium]|nr:diguanylate cyclase [Thermoanaerobaculia bacterium]
MADVLNCYFESMQNAKVLIVEDDANLSHMLTRRLEREGYSVGPALTIAAARELLNERWDLVLLDRQLPDGDGIDLCRELRAADPHVYILMLSGFSSEAARIEGFESGADDYVAKPAALDELMARVRAGLRIVSLQRRLLELSQTDSLTSLPNRRAFDARFGNAFEQARRYQRPLSLALLDVDHFKAINDTHGHDAGDTVLRGVAKILEKGTRQADFAARVGGEEFAVLLPETALFDALQFGEKLRAAVASSPVHGHGITVSVGVANVPYSKAASPAEFFRMADEALYRAKRRGRNRVEAEQRRQRRESGALGEQIAAPSAG